MLQEFVKFRTEVGRELLNVEVDKNFKYVANPWSSNRVYTVGMIVYHSVAPSLLGAGTTDNTNTDTSGTTGTNEILAWFRAKETTTLGSFLMDEWEVIGGSGADFAANLNFFEDIVVNSTIPGNWSTMSDATILPSGSDSLHFVSGDGILIDHDVVQNLIRINTDLTVTFNPFTGDLDIQGNVVNLGNIAGYWERDDINGFVYPLTITDKVGINTITPNGFLGIVTQFSNGTDNAIDISNPTENILKIDDSSKFSFGLSEAQRHKEMAMSSTSFSAIGDAQKSRVMFTKITTGSSYEEVFLDGLSETVGLYTDTSILGFKITVAAIQETGSKEAMLRVYKGAIKKDLTSTLMIGAVTEETFAEDISASSWEVEISADDTGDYLKVRVRGDGSTIRWVLDVDLLEINVQ